MSSALCVFIHASETGHAEGVPIEPSRGCSVEVPFGRERLTEGVFTVIVLKGAVGDLGKCSI